MTNKPNKDIKIDAVILWVDGDDDSYHSKISAYLDKQPNATKSFNSRYVQVNEIEYSVNSILKYAPFVNTIFIVTDSQTPPFVKQNESNSKYSKVKVVDHTELFKGFEGNLPTFNSRTIETCLHRIPDLSEHFIYLNDDFFIINQTSQNDFFTENGFPVLRGIWQKFDTKKKGKAGHKEAQDKAAKILDFKKLFRFKHTPHPIRKSTLETYFNENPEVFLENISYKFRNKSQFLPVALANHLEIKNKTCQVQTDLQLLYFRSYKKPLIWYKFKLNVKSKSKLFLGLQSLNKAPSRILDYIINWLNKRMS
jgi:hypothetical protein